MSLYITPPLTKRAGTLEDQLAAAKAKRLALQTPLADKVVAQVGNAAKAVPAAAGKVLDKTTSGIANATSAGLNVVDKINPLTPDQDAINANADELSNLSQQITKQRNGIAKGVASQFAMPKPGEHIAANPLVAGKLPGAIPAAPIAPKLPGAIVKDTPAPNPDITAKAVADLKARGGPGASQTEGLMRFLTGRNAIGAGLGGALGYAGSKLMSDDEDEAGITPEEKARRASANTRRALLLSSLGAAGGGTAAHLTA
jgi:hypothetical protein